MDDLMTTDACTLPAAERPLRLTELDDLFTTHLTRLAADGDGVRMSLRGDPGLRDRVLDLTARESQCCSFFTFTVEGTDAEVDLGIRVPPSRRDILDALVARASADAAGTP